MQVEVKINSRTIVTADGATVAEIFEQVAALQEIFGVERCGKCGGDKLRFVCREAQGFKFYEVHCLNQECKARFAFGQSKQHPGQLFPRPKGEWHFYRPDGGDEPEQPQAGSSPSSPPAPAPQTPVPQRRAQTNGGAGRAGPASATTTPPATQRYNRYATDIANTRKADFLEAVRRDIQADPGLSPADKTALLDLVKEKRSSLSGAAPRAASNSAVGPGTAPATKPRPAPQRPNGVPRRQY
jgi:hypothetical protein